MPSPTSLRRLAATGCLAIALSASAAGRDGAGRVLPAPSSDGGLALVARGGRAWVADAGGRREAVALGLGERLLDFVAEDGGWAAAGAAGEGGSASRLFVVRSGATGQERLAPPRQRPVALRPRLLAAPGGDVEGLAWLEGEDSGRLAVVAADLDGAAWGQTLLVAPAGGGAQTGLAGTVLADGSWLLVWARFDGRDDEIFWSRRRGYQWSEPRRLAADNRVPDVLPAVVASGRGALVAWSRFDRGQYRVATSAFDGRAFSPPRLVGEPGSYHPSFIAAAGPTVLLYRRAEPAGWTAAELDRGGRVRRRAAIATAEARRPLVDAGARRARFSWPGPRGRALRAPWETR